MLRNKERVEYKVLLDPVLLLNITASFKIKTPIYKHDILGLLLFADTLIFPELIDINIFNDYSNIVKISELPPEELINPSYWKTELDPIGSLYLALLNHANARGAYFFISKEQEIINNVVRITKGYLHSYLPKLKESLLIQDILDFILSEEIAPHVTYIDATKFMKSARIINEFKRGFQEGIIMFTKKLCGQYYLNDENKKWIKQYIRQKEAELFKILKPENLKKFDITASVTDILGIVESLSPILINLPWGTLIEFIRYLHRKGLLKDKGISFTLSLMIIKRIIRESVGGIEPINCPVCALTLEEIEQMSDEEANKIVLNKKLCINHIIAYLDIRKKYRLTGKKLLKAMKEYY